MSTSEEIPENVLYTKEHEWVRRDGDEWVVGITAFAAGQLGDVVFVELPEVGSTLKMEDTFGVVESVKSVSDLFVPLSGTVTEINSELESAPEWVNDSPYDKGWMIRIKADASFDENTLLSPEAYKNSLL